MDFLPESPIVIQICPRCNSHVLYPLTTGSHYCYRCGYVGQGRVYVAEHPQPEEDPKLKGDYGDYVTEGDDVAEYPQPTEGGTA